MAEVEVSLGEVCEVSSTLVDPTLPQYGEWLHVGGANIESATGRLVDLKAVEDEGLRSGKYSFDDRMVLYSKIRPYLRKVARPGFRGLCSADIYPLLPADGRLDRGYLYHLLLSPAFTDYAIAGSARAGMPKVNREHLFAFRFRLPAISDQRRVALLMDESFAGVATVRANTEKNLRNVGELLNSYTHHVFEGGSARWEKRSLDSVCTLFVDSAHRTPTYQDQGLPALRPRDVVNGRLNLTAAARVSEAEYEVQTRRHRPSPGDIVYSRELSYGWAAAVPPDARVCLSQGMCLFRPSSVIDSTYLLAVLNGPIGRAQATHAAVGAAHPHINLGDIKAFRIPLPPLVVQEEVAQRVSSMAAETERLEGLYQQKLTALDSLTGSVLGRAFAGAR